MPRVINVMLCYLVFLLVFGILGVQVPPPRPALLARGLTSYFLLLTSYVFLLVLLARGLASAPSARLPRLPPCTCVIVTSSLRRVTCTPQLFGGKFTSCYVEGELSVGSASVSALDRRACLSAGHEWRTPHSGSFDDIRAACLLLFEMSSLEGWPVIMCAPRPSAPACRRTARTAEPRPVPHSATRHARHEHRPSHPTCLDPTPRAWTPPYVPGRHPTCLDATLRAWTPPCVPGRRDARLMLASYLGRYAGIDASTSESSHPTRDAHPLFALYFIVWVLAGGMVLINLFVGVLVEAFADVISAPCRELGESSARARPPGGSDRLLLTSRPPLLPIPRRPRVAHASPCRSSARRQGGRG